MEVFLIPKSEFDNTLEAAETVHERWLAEVVPSNSNSVVLPDFKIMCYGMDEF